MIGTDPAGRLLELITLVFDSGHELIIHAMKARPHYLDEL
ncbi:MAG: toxin-antitoxin system toxin subunit [Aeromicrobium sp.]